MIDSLLDFISAQAGTIGLVLFVTVFTLILISVSLPGSTARFRANSAIPLREDDTEEALNHD